MAPPLVGAAIGFAWFILIGGGYTLNPTDLSWMFGDHAQHLYGWLFFRNDPWSLPLGAIRSLAYPLGTTLGFTDANPWVSVLLKPLSPWLPRDLQFIGPWLAASFTLQGVLGAKIMEALTPSFWQRVCGAALFVLAPPLLIRIGHDTLSAHWLVLALIWLHLRPSGTTQGAIAWAYVFCGIAAGVHPYLAGMVVVLALALFLQMYLQGRVSATAAIGESAGVLLLVGAIFTLFGYFTPGTELAVGGFGLYSVDLLTFVNPIDYSRWLPELPSGEGQYEGFSFMGSGVLALALGGLGMALSRRLPLRVPRRARPLLIAAALLGFFALSNHVTIAGHEVLTMRKFYDLMGDLTGPFRASGRFIWPLHYVVMTGILALWVGTPLVSRAVLNTLLAVVVAIQIVEVRPERGLREDHWNRLASPAWSGLGSSYRHLALFPPYYASTPPDCEPTSFTWDDTFKLLDVAYRERMTINSGYLARTSMPALGAYCQQLRRGIEAGRLARNTVYIVSAKALDRFKRPELNAVCGVIDGFNVCVDADSSAEFRSKLAHEAAPR